MVLALFIFLFCFCGALFTPTNGAAELEDTKDGSTANQPVIFNSSPVVHSNTSLSQSSTVTQSSRNSSFNSDTIVSTASPSSSSPISSINAGTSSATSSSLNPSTDDSGSLIRCYGVYLCKENEVCGPVSNPNCLCKEDYHRINDTCQPKLSNRSTLPTTSLPESSSLQDLSSSTTLKIVEDNATSTTSSDSLPPYTGRVVSCVFYNCKENEICDKFSRGCKCKENYLQVNGICQPNSHETPTALHNVSTESSLKAVTNVTSMRVSNSTFRLSSISLKPNFTTTTAPNGENFTSNTATSNNLDTTSTAVTANSKTFTKTMSSTEVTISTSTDTPSYINVTGTTTINFDTTISTGIMSTSTDSSTTELSGENTTLSTTIPSSGSTTSSKIIPSSGYMTSSATTSIRGNSASTTTSVHESTNSSTTEPSSENTTLSTTIPSSGSTTSSTIIPSGGDMTSSTTTSIRGSSASSTTRPSSRSTAFTTAVRESIGSSAIRPGGMSTPLTSITSNSKVTTPTVMDHVDINSTTFTSKKHENTSTTTTNKSTFLTTYTVSKSTTSTSDTSKYIEKSTAVTSNFKDSTSTSAQPRSKATLNVHTLIPMSISSDTTVDQRFPTTSDPWQSSYAASMTKRETPVASSAIPEQEVVSSTSVSSKSKNTILKPTTLEQEISTFATSTISTLSNETTTLQYTLGNVTFYTTPGNITTTLLSQSSDDSVTITSTSPSVDNSSSVELRGHEAGKDSRGAIAYGVGFSCGVIALAVPIAFIVIRIKRIQEHRHQLLSSTDNVSA